jgi:DNA-binding transcriptional regulator YiaG
MTAEELVLLGIARRRAKDGSGRRIRTTAHLSLRLIADAIAVSEGTVCRWEKGERRPSGNAGVRWARLLDQLDKANTKAAQAA